MNEEQTQNQSNLINYIATGLATIITALLLVCLQTVQTTKEDVVLLKAQVQHVSESLADKYTSQEKRISQIEEKIESLKK
jgi:TolA-binding protein